jgi:hypothetical protein
VQGGEKSVNFLSGSAIYSLRQARPAGRDIALQDGAPAAGILLPVY